MALVPPADLVSILDNALSQAQLLSAYGMRSISAWHRDHPFTIDIGGASSTVDYEPAESITALFGGNSNWRGPIWLPLNAMLIQALRCYDVLSPGKLSIEYPNGSVTRQTLPEIADDVTDRHLSIFVPGPDGRPPVYGSYDLLATDPRWNTNIPFHEYFNGDTGQGLGAEHQTGWTALIAHLLLTQQQSNPPGGRLPGTAATSDR